ncbi:MAG: hypothetical protein ACN4GM_16340 [Gammaproteobacteria bacterium]
MKIFKTVLYLILFTQANAVIADSTKNDDHWWNGFSITPGIGFRHLGFDVTRKSDGYTGNISNAGFAQTVATISMTSPSVSLNRSGTISFELQYYTALLELDHQFYAYGGTDPEGGNSGERVDVGTSIDGYYSYLIPAIKARLGYFAASFGVGYWISRFNGDIILTPNDQPASFMPTTSIDMSDRKELAYLFTMSWTTENNWIFLMSVGGTNFDDDLYEYKTEEVALIVGKHFVF